MVAVVAAEHLDLVQVHAAGGDTSAPACRSASAPSGDVGCALSLISATRTRRRAAGTGLRWPGAPHGVPWRIASRRGRMAEREQEDDSSHAIEATVTIVLPSTENGLSAAPGCTTGMWRAVICSYWPKNGFTALRRGQRTPPLLGRRLARRHGDLPRADLDRRIRIVPQVDPPGRRPIGAAVRRDDDEAPAHPPCRRAGRSRCCPDFRPVVVSSRFVIAPAAWPTRPPVAR